MNRSAYPKILLGVGGAVLAVTAAIAGSGVGSVFNLGQTNTVNARTLLQGNTTVQQLHVVNQSTAAGSVGMFGTAGGTGMWGQSVGRVGVRASATGRTGTNYGLFAETASRDGFAGYFRNTGDATDRTRGTAIRVLGAGATGNEFPDVNYAGGGEFAGPNGVYAVSTAPGGAGVTGVSGKGDYAVYGYSTSSKKASGYFVGTQGTGVIGLGEEGITTEIDGWLSSGGKFAGQNGIVAASSVAGGIGVVAVAPGGGLSLYASGPAEVTGNLRVGGTLTKGSGTFKIDHPLDPANKYLSHSFVESPDMMNIYNGNVVTDESGEATVELPDYFEALNRDPRYQLTVIGSPATAYISRKMSDNHFAIETSEPGVEVSWQVTGIRKDAFALAHPVIVEEEKAVADRGRYLHPAELGQPASLGIGREPSVQDVAARRGLGSLAD